MLPGFNHNIRYKDRVFHVQTEDNGLNQPRLITQVFIDGHILALEKSTYEDIISANADEKSRDDQIRTKMQDQHKQLLKNLVQGQYDGRILAYLGETPSRLPLHEDIPVEVVAEAIALPNAPADPNGFSGDIDAIIIEAPEEISPESLLDPEFLKEISAAIEGETRNDPPPRPPTPIAHLANDLRIPGGVLDPDSAALLDAERRRQLPYEQTQELPIPEPVEDEDRITIRPPLTPPRMPPARPRGGQNERDPMLGSRAPTRREPPAADTLVDFGLPAALRDTLSRAQKTPPRKNDALLDMELRNAAAQLGPIVEQPPNDQTMLELDAAALQRQIAEQRERLRRAQDQPTVDESDEDEKEVVVVERSLDEVILSYLSDDPE